MHRSFQQYLAQLVRSGLRKLRRYGQTDSLGRCVVYLVHRTCYCSITLLDEGQPKYVRGNGLFFWGWFRPARWWSNFSFWDWQTPSHPDWVIHGGFTLLRDVPVWQLIRVLYILRRSRVISPTEFFCATLVGANR
ncbi:MAG: hypothetical protein PHI63_01350 [Patescibacteria group bacterium]|nr:hypothetical protein [Patescibacteria group bacterium]